MNFECNVIDQVQAAVNAIGGTTRLSYDGRNDLARVNNARGVDAMTFVNDQRDQVVSESAAGDESQYVYDGAGQLVRRVDPNGSVWTPTAAPSIIPTTGSGVWCAGATRTPRLSNMRTIRSDAAYA